MTPRLEFGVDQLIVYTDLKPASQGWNKGHTLDLRFEILEQIICQALGPVGVVSNCTINDLNFHSGGLS